MSSVTSRFRCRDAERTHERDTVTAAEKSNVVVVNSDVASSAKETGGTRPIMPTSLRGWHGAEAPRQLSAGADRLLWLAGLSILYPASVR